MNQDPSVLDFIKSRMRYWLHKILPLSSGMAKIEESEFWIEASENGVPVQASPIQTLTETPFRFPWHVLLVLGLGLFAQLSLEPHPGSERTWQFGVILYVWAGLVLIWINWRHEWAFPAWDLDVRESWQDRRFLRSSLAFIASLVFSLIAFLTFGGNRFTSFNVVVWFIAILTMIRAFWHPDINNSNWVINVRDFIARSRWNISLNRSTLLVLAVLGLVLFFRIYHLSDVPSQMVSDHAEKLLDVGDVLNGETAIFFLRNTGREFFQFYLTAAIILLFKTGLTFLSLKIGTILAGLVTLFYIYLLGKEIGNNRVGLLALAFAGIAYWPNVISRFGLRFPLYPLFYAPALYYLIWGLRTRNRNGFILSGLFLGLGLH